MMVPGSRNPAHQARAWDLSLSLAVWSVGGAILGPGSGWDSRLVLLRCQALLHYKTQVQCCVWDVQDRDSVWKKRTGNGGGGVCKEHPIPASPLTLPLALPQEEAGRQGPQTPGAGAGAV